MQERLESPVPFQDRFRECTHIQKIGEKDVPYTLMESEAPKDKTTVCFIPGLGLPYTTYEKSLEALHASGRSFCAFGYARAELPTPPEAKEWIDKKLVTGEHVQRALGFIEMIKSLGDSIHRPVDVIAHSMGAIYATLAAALEPDLFRSLVLYAPAGFIEKKDEPDRIRHAAMDSATIVRNQRLTLTPGTEGEYARDFLGKAVRGWATFSMQHFFNMPSQMRSIVSAFIPSIVRDLDARIHVSVELGEKDALFPPELLRPALEEFKIPYIIHEGADHHTIGTSEKIMRAMVQKLSDMNGREPAKPATAIGN